MQTERLVQRSSVAATLTNNNGEQVHEEQMLAVLSVAGKHGGTRRKLNKN